MTIGKRKRGALRQAPRRSAQLLELDLTIERLQSRLARTHDERERDIKRQQEVIDDLRRSFVGACAEVDSWKGTATTYATELKRAWGQVLVAWCAVPIAAAVSGVVVWLIYG